jgi:cell division septal protein FtsQ
MYDRRLQETRARKESLRFKNVASFYLILLVMVLTLIFFTNDVFGLSKLIFGVKGVIIKGMGYDLYIRSYNLKDGYLKNFTIFNFGNFVEGHKPDFVKSVKLHYVFFDKFVITFTLKEKVAIIHEGDSYYFIDSNGEIWGHPTIRDIEENLIIFDVNHDFDIKSIRFLKKYVDIISEIDYGRSLIYFKKGKILKFRSWSDLISNKQILSYIYEILGPKRELFLIKNKIMIK